MTTRLFILMVWAVPTLAQDSRRDPNAPPVDPCAQTEIQGIIQKVRAKAKSIQSYEAQVDYIINQAAFESRTQRRGRMYYKRGPVGSRLRVDFDTLQQDVEPIQDCKDQYVFDGVWLTHLDHQIHSAQKRQLTEPNKPRDAFDLVGEDIPVLGFTAMEDLDKDFVISRGPSSEQADPNIVRLVMETKPGSKYHKDYRTLDLWIDLRLDLPVRVDAESGKDETHCLRFTSPKLNSPIDDKVFEVPIPAGFGPVEVVPLDQDRRGGS